MSGFAWLDYSEHERRKALDVVRLFQDKGTVDELGIGTVRDALADSLFPGISTIQTRARYFLFVPWIGQSLERDRIASADADRIGRHREVELIKSLMDSDDLEGVIGREAGAKLRRLPSEIYWSGLRVLGMRRYSGARSQYYRSLDHYHRYHHVRRANAEDGISDALVHQVNWHESLPPAPGEFPHAAELALTYAEADYLRQQILAQVSGSMLAFAVDRSAWETVEYPWLHPNAAEVAPALAKLLRDARNFSLLMHGAALLYNLLMAEKRAASFGEFESQYSPDSYREELSDWAEKVQARGDELRRWVDRREQFWAGVSAVNPSIHRFTKQFVDDYLRLAVDDSVALAGNRAAHDLIRRREHRMKEKRARLTNPRALELWGGQSGTTRLGYRWGQAQTILLDILQGLQRHA